MKEIFITAILTVCLLAAIRLAIPEEQYLIHIGEEINKADSDITGEIDKQTKILLRRRDD